MYMSLSSSHASTSVMRYVNNQFSDDRESTIGAAFLTQHMKVGEDTIKFEIWWVLDPPLI